MRRMRLTALLLCLLTVSAHALTERELQGFIDDAIKAGGGEVVIPPGTHLLEKGLKVKNAKKLRLVGYDTEQTILKLPPIAFAEVSTEGKPGDKKLCISRHQRLTPGMKIQIEADGEIEPFTNKPRPYQRAVIEQIVDGALLLKEPLKFRVPAKTLIRDPDAPNLIEVTGTCEDLRIEKLTLEGGRIASDPPVRGHAQLCGVFVQGPYSYEKGVTGPRVKSVKVERCIIQNCHGRGIALYAAEDCLVQDCVIMDTSDEAVDLDHFTQNTVVRHNHLTRSLVGVELNDAIGCTVVANEISHCGTGINLWRWCKMPELNQGNRIEDNAFSSMKGNAIQIAKATSNNSAVRNDIRDSGRNGIIVSGSQQLIRDNKIERSAMKDIAEVEPGAILTEAKKPQPPAP